MPKRGEREGGRHLQRFRRVQRVIVAQPKLFIGPCNTTQRLLKSIAAASLKPTEQNILALSYASRRCSLPQHHTAPEVSRAQVCSSSALTVANAWSPLTAVGVKVSAVCPLRPRTPQHHAVLSGVMAHVWRDPAEMAVKARLPETGTGGRWSSVLSLPKPPKSPSCRWWQQLTVSAAAEHKVGQLVQGGSAQQGISNSLTPQHHAWDEGSGSSAHVWPPPELTVWKARSPATSTGVAIDPLSSWPAPSSPE